jgi:hypothetical protein
VAAPQNPLAPGLPPAAPPSASIATATVPTAQAAPAAIPLSKGLASLAVPAPAAASPVLPVIVLSGPAAPPPIISLPGAAAAPAQPGLDLGRIALDTDEPVAPQPRPRPRRRGRRHWVGILVFGAVLAGLIGIGIVAAPRVLELLKRLQGHEAADAVWVRHSPADAKFKFSLTVRRRDWEENKEARADLVAFVALRRADPDVGLAIAAKDFAPQEPGDAAMEKEAIERLDRYFQNALAKDALPGTEELAGRRARRLPFEGKRDGVPCQGICYLFSNRGIGYWVFVWARTRDIALEQLKVLQSEKGNGLVVED